MHWQPGVHTWFLAVGLLSPRAGHLCRTLTPTFLVPLQEGAIQELVSRLDALLAAPSEHQLCATQAVHCQRHIHCLAGLSARLCLHVPPQHPLRCPATRKRN